MYVDSKSMKKYRKLIVAIIGVLLLAGKELLGIEIGVAEDQIYLIVISIVTAFGVYQVRNEE